jgi:hypothetical protein
MSFIFSEIAEVHYCVTAHLRRKSSRSAFSMTSIDECVLGSASFQGRLHFRAGRSQRPVIIAAGVPSSIRLGRHMQSGSLSPSQDESSPRSNERQKRSFSLSRAQEILTDIRQPRKTPPFSAGPRTSHIAILKRATLALILLMGQQN